MKRVKDQGSGVKALFVIFILSSCIFNYAYAEPEKGSMARAEKLFLEGKYESVIGEADKLIDSDPRNKDELYYIKALSELKTGRFKEARNDFEYIISRYQRSKRTFDAHVGIGDSYLLEGNRAAAVRVYNDILRDYPNDKNISIVHERLNKDHDKAADVNFKPVEPPRTETADSFSVQVGSFKNKRNAEKLAQKLHGSGYDGYIAMPIGPADKLYRVRVGHLSSRKEAEALAARLKARGYKTKICGD